MSRQKCPIPGCDKYSTPEGLLDHARDKHSGIDLTRYRQDLAATKTASAPAQVASSPQTSVRQAWKLAVAAVVAGLVLVGALAYIMSVV